MDRNEKDQALLPAQYLYDQTVLSDPGDIYADGSRVFQGIPGIECTARGTYFSVFYTGMDNEKPGNFVLLQRGYAGEDGIPVFGTSFMAVVPPTPNVRCFDPCLWISPDGKLRLFYAQSFDFHDGRAGVWMAVCDDPDAEEVRFSAPRRIANGVMMNKPITLSTGEWLLPCAIWKFIDSEWNRLEDERFSNVYCSEDGGETFSLIGHSAYEDRLIDEHMMYERADGSVRMLIRAKNGIGEAVSFDKGYTWTNEKDSGLCGPCSRFCVRRLKSGRLLLVNHYQFTGRNNLTAMLSEDDGETWKGFLLLDERTDVSYPDAAESPDGFLNIIYDYKRYGDKQILLARVTEEDILAGRLVNQKSALRILVNQATGTVLKTKKQ